MSSRLALPSRPISGLVMCSPSRCAMRRRSCASDGSKLNRLITWTYTFITPRMLRLTVFSTTISLDRSTTSSMKSWGTPNWRSAIWNSAGSRSRSDLEGANGTSTGNMVSSFTRNARFGREKTTVAYQSPNGEGEVLDGRLSTVTRRSRSFLVAKTRVNRSPPVHTVNGQVPVPAGGREKSPPLTV